MTLRLVLRGGGLICSIRAGGDGSSAQWWVDRQKAVPIDRAAEGRGCQDFRRKITLRRNRYPRIEYEVWNEPKSVAVTNIDAQRNGRGRRKRHHSRVMETSGRPHSPWCYSPYTDKS